MTPPLLVIVGETGSGKSALAVELAKRFNGEIISADSRTIYRGMDIGTAKPTLEERQGVPHYGFDVVDPSDPFSAYDFKLLALDAIARIASRGKLPIMVGGTGLYIDAVLYDYHFRPKPDEKIRMQLQALSVEELRERVIVAGLQLPRNDRNSRHLARLLEAGVTPAQPPTLRPNTLILGLTVSRDTLKQRIAARVKAMVAAGLAEEVRGLRGRYGNVEALKAPGYKAFGAFIDGEIGLEEAERQFIQADMRLAKRQRTWFKRNKSIHWLNSADVPAQAVILTRQFVGQ